MGNLKYGKRKCVSINDHAMCVTTADLFAEENVAQITRLTKLHLRTYDSHYVFDELLLFATFNHLTLF